MEEFLPGSPARTLIREQVINLVDRREDGPGVPFGMSLDEFTDGQVYQPGRRLAWHPGLEQRESVGIMLGQRGARER